MVYNSLVPTPAESNNASVQQHPGDVATYVTTELEEGEMLGLYEDLPFVLCCQVNALLMQLKKDSHL